MIANKDIVLDPELEALLPPLSEDENTELLRSIAKDGFTDPIIVWLNHGVLVDGHNRHRIWRDVYASDEDKAPAIVEKHFDSRDDVKEFMLRRQIGRRNLTVPMRVAIALQLKPMIVAKAKAKQVASGGDRKSGKSVSPKSDEPIRVDEEIAKAAGVGRDTVRKVEAVLATDNEPLKADMLAGKTSINTSYEATIAALSKDTPPKRRQQFKALRQRDVDLMGLTIKEKVKAIVARVKRTSTEAISAMPLLAATLKFWSDELGILANEVSEKIGGRDDSK